jgi:hypothetical protein
LGTDFPFTITLAGHSPSVFSLTRSARHAGPMAFRFLYVKVSVFFVSGGSVLRTSHIQAGLLYRWPPTVMWLSASMLPGMIFDWGRPCASVGGRAGMVSPGKVNALSMCRTTSSIAASPRLMVKIRLASAKMHAPVCCRSTKPLEKTRSSHRTTGANSLRLPVGSPIA